MDLLAKGVTFIKSIFSTNPAIKEFKDEFIAATIDWISPIFLEVDEDLEKELKQDQIDNETEMLLKIRLKDLIKKQDGFSQKLEYWIKKSESQKIKPTTITNTDNSTGKNASVTGGSIVGGNQSNSHNTTTNTNSNNYNSNNNNSNNNNSNNTTTNNYYYSRPQFHELLPEEVEKDSPNKKLEPTFFNVKKLLRQDWTNDAIELLAVIIDRDNYRKHYEEMIINFSSRWYRLKRSIQSGTISYENASVAKASLNSAITSTVNDMRDEVKI